ncbi:MAG: hypothetical protein NVSMB33_15790 [Ktedonobacteraceae bacterium]
MVAVHNFATRKAGIARLLRGNFGIWTTRTEEGLGQAVGKQAFADVFWAGEQVGMTDLLGSEYVAQQVDGVFMADDMPARLSC